MYQVIINVKSKNRNDKHKLVSQVKGRINPKYDINISKLKFNLEWHIREMLSIDKVKEIELYFLYKKNNIYHCLVSHLRIDYDNITWIQFSDMQITYNLLKMVKFVKIKKDRPISLSEFWRKFPNL